MCIENLEPRLQPHIPSLLQLLDLFQQEPVSIRYLSCRKSIDELQGYIIVLTMQLKFQGSLYSVMC